jgi:hypothetical protein
MNFNFSLRMEIQDIVLPLPSNNFYTILINYFAQLSSDRLY